MANDSCLRSNPQYKHLFEDNPRTPAPDVRWLQPVKTGEITLRNSVCGQYQVRKHGEPAVYDLLSIKIPPFARPIKTGLKSFDEVRSFLQEPVKTL